MTTTATPVPTPRPVRPFQALEVDPQKCREGVWIRHPDSGDQVRIRRRFNPDHVAAYHAVRAEHEAQHGAGTGESDEADRLIDAKAMARAIVVDWRLEGDASRPYDAEEMAALLADPDYSDLRHWITVQAERRANFRPVASEVKP